MISFHRKCLSINLKVSQIEEAWSQDTLASAGIFGNCGGNTFFCLFHLQVTDAYQAIVHVGARLKCGIIYIFVWEGVFGEGVGG